VRACLGADEHLMVGNMADMAGGLGSGRTGSMVMPEAQRRSEKKKSDSQNRGDAASSGAAGIRG